MQVLNFGKKFPQALSRIQRCNVLIVGNTGVGKSTLIGALFKQAVSTEVTQKISEKPYNRQGLPIAAYDSPGLEKDKKQRDRVKKEVADRIRQQNRKEPCDQIHAIWYCINSQTNRESDIDHKWIKQLAKEVPVIGVITRASGIERSDLLPHLEGTAALQQVVRIMAKQENIEPHPVLPYGMTDLLAATEELLEGIAQKAIVNAINAKADKAYAWCRDGCAKMIATQFAPHFAPLPFLKLLTGPTQTQLLIDIAKEFGCKFSREELSQLPAVGLGIAGFGSIDLFVEEQLKNLPGIDWESTKTLTDAFSYLSSALDKASLIPFKENLQDLFSFFANSKLVGSLPIVSSISSTVVVVSTILLAFSFIETMKKLKQAEYEGQPMPDLEDVFAREVKQMMENISGLTSGNWRLSFSG